MMKDVMTGHEMIDRQAVEATVDAVHNDPKVARVTFSVAGEWAGGFRINSTTGKLRQGGVIDASRTGRFTVGASEVRVQVALDAPGHNLEELRELIAVVESRSPIRDTLARAVPVVTTLQIA
jgi:hypothetical protein